jgi:hypothetical protein
MLSSSERQICDQLGITERDYLKHRATGLDRLSLHAAKGTGTIGKAIESCRRFVVSAINSGDEKKLAAAALEAHTALQTMLDAASDEGSARMTVSTEHGNRMLAMPIRTR